MPICYNIKFSEILGIIQNKIIPTGNLYHKLGLASMITENTSLQFS